MKEYVECGAKLCFLIDSIHQKAHIYRPDFPTEEVNDFDAELTGFDIMPGFVLPLRLFK
ncbi:hypothetical protein BH10BAC3_BH10BAC3_02640 [soil metagenome]